MKRAALRFGRGFKVVTGNRRSQAATMRLGPGENEGGADNRHRGADQWLFVENTEYLRPAGLQDRRGGAAARPQVVRNPDDDYLPTTRYARLISIGGSSACCFTGSR